jgi:hypothetical protein
VFVFCVCLEGGRAHLLLAEPGRATPTTATTTTKALQQQQQQQQGEQMANNNDSKASMEQQQQQQQPGNQGLSCPLCQNRFADRAQVEQHAATVHNVNAEGLERLMLLVEQANWLNANHATTTATTTTAATTATTTAAATTATAAATR